MGFGPGWEQDVLSIPQSSRGAGIPVRMGGVGEVGADLWPTSQRGSDLGWVIDAGQRGTAYLGGARWGGRGLLLCMQEFIFHMMHPVLWGRECKCLPLMEITGGEKGGLWVWLFLPLPRSPAVNWRSLSGHKEKYQ